MSAWQGLLGVGVFFVLSGYLITDILITQWKRNGRLDWKDFWLRRVRRLMPALLYVNNWWRIFNEVSYFSSYGPPSPFGHFWSLAVEEQFYLLRPLLLVIGLRFVPRR
jgi:peptidoglycan/LPS O-acetylase OafA/YrhL